MTVGVRRAVLFALLLLPLPAAAYHPYDRAVSLEWLCEVWLRAYAVGMPRLLDDEQIAQVVDKLATYGVRAATLDPLKLEAITIARPGNGNLAVRS